MNLRLALILVAISILVFKEGYAQDRSLGTPRLQLEESFLRLPLLVIPKIELPKEQWDLIRKEFEGIDPRTILSQDHKKYEFRMPIYRPPTDIDPKIVIKQYLLEKYRRLFEKKK